MTSDRSEEIYFKQYGLERTGTNYLKRLLELNYSGVTVLGSVLGWKHGLYQSNNGSDPDCRSHSDWLRKKSEENVVYSVDGHRLPFSRQELESIIPKLKYVVSIKDTRSWIYSFKQFRSRRKPWSAERVSEWCSRLVLNYQNWIELLEEHDGAVIEYEALLRDFSTVLTQFERRFGLQRSNNVHVNETRVVKASTDLGLNISSEKFVPTFYKDEEFLMLIPDDVLRSIASFDRQIAPLLQRMKPFTIDC